MKRLHLITILLIAVAIGFASHAVKHFKGEANEDVRLGASPSKSRNGQSFVQRAEEIRLLTEGIARKGGEEEWFRWLASLENASLSDLPQFVASVGNNAVALNLIAARWVALNPENGLRYLLSQRAQGDFIQQDSSGLVFSEFFFEKWMQRDLEAVVAALESSDAPARLDKLRELVIQELLKSDLPRALAQGSQWKSFHRYSGVPPLLEEWVENDPRAAVQAIFELPSDSFLKPLAELWGASDPRAALDFAFHKGGDRGFQFAEIVFTKWSQDDFPAASQKLSELSEQQANFLTPALIESWSKKEPIAALKWTQQSLTGRLENDSIERIVLASAYSGLASPKDLLAQIESPQAYQQAVVGLSHQLWGQGYSPNDSIFKKAVTWFDDVDEPQTLEKIFTEFSNFLSYYDFDQFRKFVESERAQTVSPFHFSHAMGLYYYTGTPEGAMDLISESKSSIIPAATANVFGKWYEDEPEAAVTWAERLSPDDARLPYLVKELRRNFYFKPHTQAVDYINSQPKIIKTMLRKELVTEMKTHPRSFGSDGKQIEWAQLLAETVGEE